MSPRESAAGLAAGGVARPRLENGSGSRRVRRARSEINQRLLPPRLVVLALSGWLLFGYPFLAAFSRPERLFGIPLLFVYLFVAWGGFIAVIARLVDSGGRRR